MNRNFHVSMRVPWRDRPWDDRVCNRPLDNSSCVLLKNIGDNREDSYEVGLAGQSFVDHDVARLPCLSERATFMSSTGYRVRKTHPYAFNRNLKEHLEPTDVDVPPFGVEAVPFRWLSRETFEADLWHQWDAGYDPDAEVRIHDLLGFKPGWLMDGANQQAVIAQFFDCVSPGESLVFFYLKHSPLQDTDPRRLLVGAAVVTNLRRPGMWSQRGKPPFDSSMWETALVHSLRADGKHGLLLPYQDLVALMDAGQDVAPYLAWAPDGHDLEFSYVTEHVTDDTAIEALRNLRAAAEAMRGAGMKVPEASFTWLDKQLARLWQLRGPTPGLGAVLSYIGVRAGHRVARELLGELDQSADVWATLRAGFADITTLPDLVRSHFTSTPRATWRAIVAEERDALQLLSTMQVTDEQVAMIMDGNTAVSLSAGELVANPYYASICSYGTACPIEFATVDRACLPDRHVTWMSALPRDSVMEDDGDRRRVEGLLVEILERQATLGDTVTPESDLLDLAAEVPVTRPVPLSLPLIKGYELDAASLRESDEWSALAPSELADGQAALKLARLDDVAHVIRTHLEPRLQAARYPVGIDARRTLDAVLPRHDLSDPMEESARAEKAAGLAELVAARLAVVVGAAGTGKTTLLEALVSIPEIKASGVQLLAPTGKARVQLEQKVKRRAQTIASFLSPSGRYDVDTGRYIVTEESGSRHDFGLVVIDEASMLTEEMLAATLDALGSVRRLVLVGDSRQLPPIGAGRPFVDLVEVLRPDKFDTPIRVAPGYVELTVLRRHQGEERDDLALAAWFGGGDLPAGADDIWGRLHIEQEMSTLRHVSWAGGSVIEALERVITDAILPGASKDPEKDFALSYGAHLSRDGQYANWATGDGGAGERSEEWQILTPTRSRLFGTVEINRHLKRTYRTHALRRAQQRWGYRFPKPYGPELIVLGDKVMQTKNESSRRAYPKNGVGLDYVANGEIGVATGRWGNQTKLPLDVEFSSQTGCTYRYWPTTRDDPPLELAWAVTVHKSQGSEFGTTIVVLPARGRMSRELLYTALTRQKERVILLHEGTIDDLQALARPTESETARRLTDLFRAPDPRVIPLDGVAHRFDANLIHVAATGVLVRSKNEVIIADILEQLVPGRWRYESEFVGADGTKRSPDFTIDTVAGDTVYWEHLGMLNNPRYAVKWQAKLAWYESNGVVPVDKGPGSNGVLITTDDLHGVDVPAWRELAERVLGSAPSRKGPAKKIAPRRRD